MRISNFSNILFLLVAFPYISLISTPFDVQPFALILSILFLLLLLTEGNNLSFPRPLGLIFFIFLYAACLYLFRSNYNYGLRSLAGYASVFFIALASYKTFRYVSLKTFYFTVFVWVFFGIVQLLFEKTFGNWLLPRMSTSVTRGITSLAPEPSSYAIICLFLLILNEIFHKDTEHSGKIYFVIMFVLLFQMVISLSGVGILCIFVFFFAKYLSTLVFNRSIKKLLVHSLTAIIPFFVIFLFLYLPVLKNTRAGRLLTIVVSNPMLLLVDASVADRVSHILLSFYSLAYSHGVGLGLGTWNDYADLLVLSAGGQVANISIHGLSVAGRIMSGWGTAIYELGLIGVLFVLIFLWIMFIGIYKNKKMKSVYASSMIILFLTMLISVPLAFPLFGYILGVFLNYAYVGYKTVSRKEIVV